MTLKDILSVINFRDFYDNKQDVYTIRIHTDINDYFDIGLNTWLYDKNECMHNILHPKLLERGVINISCSDEYLNIHLNVVEDMAE